MNMNFFLGALETANLFISVFIIVYAYLFLKKSHKHKDRRPWEFLIAGMIIFFGSEILGFLYIINKIPIIPAIRTLMVTIFAASLLYAFSHQHHLIRHQDSIRIHKKVEGQKPPE